MSAVPAGHRPPAPQPTAEETSREVSQATASASPRRGLQLDEGRDAGAGDGPPTPATRRSPEMSDVLGPWAERTDTVDGAELDADDGPLLARPCQAPGCPLRNGDHSPEEVSACLERWLTALEREAGR